MVFSANIGDFKDEYPHGSGKFFYADGVVFKGEVFRGKRQGKGETQYANGDRYVGEFFEDLKKDKMNLEL
jgi:hypothetical protein